MNTFTSFATARIFAPILFALMAVSIPNNSAALSVDHAVYAVGDTITVVCGNSSRNIEIFDVSGGPSQSSTFSQSCENSQVTSYAGEDGHEYAMLEILNSTNCTSVEYADCVSNGYVIAEVRFQVSASGTSGNSVVSPVTATNKLVYAPNETIVFTCSYSYNNFSVFDVTSGETTTELFSGQCASSTSISISSLNGHTYKVLEIAAFTNCIALDFMTCSGNGGVRGEKQFDVSSTGSGGGVQTGPGLNKSFYEPGELLSLTCTLSQNVFDVFNTTAGTGEGSIYSGACGSPTVFSFTGVLNNSYTILEVSNNTNCNSLTYADCIASGAVAASYAFQQRYAEQSTSIESFAPEVKVSTPKDGSVFSRQGTITYVATDKNDKGNLIERERLGLLATPVTLYYSDKISDWDHTITPLEDKVLIAKDQPAAGSYTWKIDGLLPGVFYRVVADVVDAIGNIGEDISGIFTVDFESPAFTVTVDPPVKRSKSVTITVASSKDLKEPPLVTVTQKGGAAVAVAMEGTGKDYTGAYAVVPGYDGVASIAVEGSDFVGNAGNTIVSGGTFAVGIDPPPKPTIVGVRDGSVTASNTIRIMGTTRDDTSVVLRVNGVAVGTSTPLGDGTYAFANVRLSLEKNRGVNTISVAAIDHVGSESESATVRVKLNSNPTVSVASPKADVVLGGKFGIDAAAKDENTDPLLFTYQIISEKDFVLHPYSPGVATSSTDGWTTLAEFVPSARFSWDSTEVEDGKYLVRIFAYDGIASVVSAPIMFSVRNTGPYFRFEDGRKTITGTTTATVTGRALAPSGITPQPTIQKAEYSMDNGLTWKLVAFTSGSSTPEARFSVRFTGLTEGTHGVLWRVTDSRGTVGRTSHAIVVDRTPPKAPQVTFPKAGAIVSSLEDTNKARDGVQIDITGVSEPGAVITLNIDGAKTEAKVGADGKYVLRNVDAGAHGARAVTLTARDEGGSVSEQTVREYINDNPPRVIILSPKNLRALKGEARVTWRIDDPDNDAITGVTLRFRKGNGAYTALPIDSTKQSYDWSLGALSEGGPYELVLEASDGYVQERGTSQFSIDTVSPRVESFTLAQAKISGKASLKAAGTASDALSGIEYMEYALVDPSVKAEPQWVTGTVVKGFLQKKASFSINHPVRLEDGTYELRVRAVDAAGNTSESMSSTVTVDTSSPRVGSFALMSSGTRIPPTSDGLVTLYEKSTATFAISLEGDTASAVLEVDGTKIPLSENIVSGLWEATFTTPPSARLNLAVSAEDAVGNTLRPTNVGELVTVARGFVWVKQSDTVTGPTPGARIRVLVLDERGQFVSRAGQVKESIPDANGSYELTLPSGQYQLVVRAPGYAQVVLPLTLQEAGVVGETFELQPLSSARAFLQSVLGYFGYQP